MPFNWRQNNVNQLLEKTCPSNIPAIFFVQTVFGTNISTILQSNAVFRKKLVNTKLVTPNIIRLRPLILIYSICTTFRFYKRGRKASVLFSKKRNPVCTVINGFCSNAKFCGPNSLFLVKNILSIADIQIKLGTKLA